MADNFIQIATLFGETGLTDEAAKGAASCIILNNSDGSISIDQISEGDQNATSTETTKVEETINGVDEILETLNGENL